MRSRLIAVALAGVLASLAPAGPALAQQGHNPHAQVPQTAEGRGVVRAINVQQGSVTIEHEPMPALGWPAMTMSFRVRSSNLLNGVSVGARVHFVLVNENGRPCGDRIPCAELTPSQRILFRLSPQPIANP